MKSDSMTDSMVKSWFGLLLALALSALNTYLWIEEKNQRYMLVAIGFLFWAYPWSQTSGPISKFFSKESASRKPLGKALTTMGWGVFITSVIAPFLPKI